MFGLIRSATRNLPTKRTNWPNGCAMMYMGLDCILDPPTLPAVFTLEIHRDTTNIGPDCKQQKNGVPLAKIFTLVCGLCSVPVVGCLAPKVQKRPVQYPLLQRTTEPGDFFSTASITLCSIASSFSTLSLSSSSSSSNCVWLVAQTCFTRL